MKVCPTVRALALLFSLSVPFVASAAEDLALGDSLRLSPVDGLPSLGGQGPSDGFSVTFTPRIPSILSGDGARLSLSARPVIERPPASGSTPYAMPGMTARAVDGGGEGAQGVVVGGALDLNETLRLGGQFSHRAGNLEQADRVTATLGIGDVTTRFDYMQLDGPERGNESRMSLGAELDAGDGMRFGADVMQINPETSEGGTTGVLRFNLEF